MICAEWTLSVSVSLVCGGRRVICAAWTLSVSVSLVCGGR